MKKIIISSIVLLITLSVIPINVSAEAGLISSMQISIKNAENPKRLEVNFNLAKPINLSQGNSNIIFEYLTKDDNGNLSVIYRKDKSWSGYLNSYDNYPSGERKYSTGAENNTAYSNTVPATTIYTSTKTSAGIDVTLVEAVKITVLRADGSGEKVTIYSNGTTSAIDIIEVPVSDTDVNTGIKLISTTALLPADTVLVADKITSGAVFDTVGTILTDVKDFIVFDIKLESDGIEIQPDGKVKISIPVPENFDSSRVTVYKIDGETRTHYPVTVTSNEGIEYATFETEHFSIYALAELEPTEELEPTKELEPTAELKPKAEKHESPQTGETSMMYFYLTITIISAIGIIVLLKRTKINSEHSK